MSVTSAAPLETANKAERIPETLMSRCVRYLEMALLAGTILSTSGCSLFDSSRVTDINCNQGLTIQISPDAVPVGAFTALISLTGTALTELTEVDFIPPGGQAKKVTAIFQNGSLTAIIGSDLLRQPGTAQVQVVNFCPANGKHITATHDFEILPAFPAPTISSLDPNAATAGGPSFTLTVHGQNFVTDRSVVQWNGSMRMTTFVDSNTVRASISASDIISAGSASVTVVDLPSNETSNSLPFRITNPLPKPGVLQLISLSTDNVHPGNDPSFSPSSSMDGRFIAFASEASDLTNDNLSSGEIFLRDTCLGQGQSCTSITRLVSHADRSFAMGGKVPPPDGPAQAPSITGNISFNASAGSNAFVFVVFETTATNLVPGGVNNAQLNIFRTKMCQTDCPDAVTTSLISANTAGDPSNGRSHSAAISANGRFVAFASAATNLDAKVPITNNTENIFVRDTCFDAFTGCTPSTYLVSMDTNGNLPNALSGSPSISADGRFVAFETAATNLGPGDGRKHVYVCDTVDRTPGHNCAPTTLVSTGFTDNPARDSEAASINASGRYVAFDSIPFPANGHFKEVLVRDTCNGITGNCTPSTSLVSVQLNQAAPDGDSFSPSISSDGRFISYVSAATQQVTGDTNGFRDVFVRDTCAGADSSCVPLTVRVSVNANGVQGNGDSGLDITRSGGFFGLSAAGNGQFTSFLSGASNLVDNDNNGFDDVFLSTTGFVQPALTLVITLLAPNSATHGGGDCRNSLHELHQCLFLNLGFGSGTGTTSSESTEGSPHPQSPPRP